MIINPQIIKIYNSSITWCIEINRDQILHSEFILVDFLNTMGVLNYVYNSLNQSYTFVLESVNLNRSQLFYLKQKFGLKLSNETINCVMGRVVKKMEDEK